MILVNRLTLYNTNNFVFCHGYSSDFIMISNDCISSVVPAD